MPSFIKVSNQIFSLGLSPKAVMAFIFLCGKANCLYSTTATFAELAQACSIDSKTAQAAIRELEQHGQIIRSNRYNTRGYLANHYDLCNLQKGKSGWFRVERAVFQTKIRPTDFLVYCFIRCNMDSRRNEAFPSLSAISAGTGISRGRVAQAVTWLRRFTYINRIKRHYRRSKAWRHNRYLEFRCNIQNPDKKERARAISADPIPQRHKHSANMGKCQVFFCESRGSPQIPKQFLDVQLPVKTLPVKE